MSPGAFRANPPKSEAEWFALVEMLFARIEELERRAGMSSRNSSKPPSSDGPETPKPPPKKPSGKKPGGQPGHEGHQRSLVPPERVDRVVDVYPEECEHCLIPLDSEDAPVVNDPVVHQVCEVPDPRADVTEYRMHARECPECLHVTIAELPPGVPTSCFGPRLHAVMGMLTGVYRLGKRPVSKLLFELYKLPISVGSVSACEQRTSAALAAPVAEAGEYIQEQRIANADETGWREQRQRAWLWVAVTAQVTVFIIHAKRGAVAAEKLLGRFAGILGSDRWVAYAKHALRKRQLCWAHLRRHFVYFSEQAGLAGKIGAELVVLTDEMFRFWHRVRDGTMTRRAFRTEMRRITWGVEDALARAKVCRQQKVAAMSREILDLAPAMWTFVRIEGVEPTNNSAERALRPAVQYRKTSFGTHSEDGSRFLERMLTTAATLRQQGRDVLAYLTEACERHVHGLPSRSILPTAHLIMPSASAQATNP